MTLRRHLTLALCFALFCAIEWTYGAKLKKQQETTMMKFIKLLFYRLIYGFANMIGLGDAAEEFGSPYKFVRDKPVKSCNVEMSNSGSGRPLTVEIIKDERTELLRRLMEITETVHRMRDYLTKTQMELYRRKSSPYEWTRDMPKKICPAIETVFLPI
ncbi:hypothetical protein ACI65C_001342 [Semiaphis heraclei]